MPDEMALPPDAAATGPEGGGAPAGSAGRGGGIHPPDVIDEFEGIEPPRRMRSPLLAILAALIAGYLLFHLRTDLAYWLHGRTAQELGDARAAVGKLPPANSFVTLTGEPDRSNAAMLDTRGKDEFRQLLRLLGTDSRLLVLRTYGKLPNDRTMVDRFSGRLVAFGDLSFAQSIREWFRTRVVATHFFDAKQLAASLGAPEVDLKDLAGDRVHLRGDSRIALDLAFPDQYRITVPHDQFPTPEAAQAALAKVGFDAITTAKLPVEVPEGPDVFVLVGRPRPEVREGVIKTIQGTSPQSVVAVDPGDPTELYVSIPKSVYPKGLPQALRELDNIGFDGASLRPLAFHAHIAAARRDTAIEALDPSIGVQPRTETWERTFAQLGAAKDFDFALVTRAKLIEPLVIPDDARVVVESDSPASYWYVAVVYVLLILFLGFNLFALREALPWRAKAASESSTR